MLFKHNEQPLTDDKASQFAYEQLRQLDCDSHLASVSGVSPSRAIYEESPSSDELLDISNSNKDIKNVNTVAPIANFPSVHGNTCLLPVVGNITDRILSEQSKRPFYYDEAYLFTCKRPKQADQDVNLDTFAEIQLLASVPLSSGLVVANHDLKRSEAAGHVDLGNDVTRSDQFTSGPSDEETVLESPIQLPSQAIGLCQADELFSPVFNYFPRRPVGIGANHQANVPEWRTRSCKTMGESSRCASPWVPSTGLHLVNEDDSEKWTGCCITLMPDSSSLASEIRLVLHKTDCSCLDEGSVRCIRQHVKEAREKLKKILGQDMFEQLGICDMGEDVAHKWTQEEEHLFQAVVLSNPSSLGKNFWDVLPHFFPARSSKELVSYYYNVFVLRKRAEQNRLDPLNVDSDDDEWQGSDDGEFAVEEEDEEDSVVESLVDQDAVTFDKGENEDAEIHEDTTEDAEIHEDTTEDADECDDYALAEKKEQGFQVVSRCYNMDKPNFLPPVEHMDKNLHNAAVEQDVQDDSCTSYEGQHCADSHGGLVDAQHGLIETCENLHGLSDMLDQEIFHGQCGTRSWDISFTCGAGNNDFLSCNAIHNGFGKEAQQKEKIDGHDFDHS